jgi:hypothetical protein
MMTWRRKPQLWIEVQSQDAALGAEPRRKAPGEQTVARLRFETPFVLEISRALRAGRCGRSDGRPKEDSSEWRCIRRAVGQRHRQMRYRRRRAECAGQHRRLRTGALAQAACAEMPGMRALSRTRNARGRSGVLAGVGLRTSVIRAVRERVRGASGGHCVSHRGMDGRNHLAEKCHDQYQATVSKASHGAKAIQTRSALQIRSREVGARSQRCRP